ncbi:MAG: hypothetical protein ABSD12_02500 [Paraburkholderia sp.]|jgi:hypothetical protein
MLVDSAVPTAWSTRDGSKKKCGTVSLSVTCYTLDLSVGKTVGDAPMESASRSPRFNATFSY